MGSFILLDKDDRLTRIIFNAKDLELAAITVWLLSPEYAAVGEGFQKGRAPYGSRVPSRSSLRYGEEWWKSTFWRTFDQSVADRLREIKRSLDSFCAEDKVLSNADEDFEIIREFQIMEEAKLLSAHLTRQLKSLDRHSENISKQKAKKKNKEEQK